MNENVIEWLRGQNTVAVTFCNGSKFYNKLQKLSKSHPEVQIKINKDGSMFAHIPLSWVKISPPRKLTDEQRQKASERLKKIRRGEKND